MKIVDGGTLPHSRSEKFINEPADQFVAVTYQAGGEPKISITFGRDELIVNQEVFREMHPGSTMFRTEVTEEDFEVSRIDFANVTMSHEVARRLRDLLSYLIDGVPMPAPKDI
ncbi:hypothetical protein [Pseudomonas oryzihabitans]|uniref:hypothetical protein n=1 Tax=Pseudomonas oryzihabitans TaxID=47885 RepID=UPI003EBA51F4